MNLNEKNISASFESCSVHESWDRYPDLAGLVDIHQLTVCNEKPFIKPNLIRILLHTLLQEDNTHMWGRGGRVWEKSLLQCDPCVLTSDTVEDVCP